MGKLFGTDGVRGKANAYPMTPELALSLGKAIAVHFGNGAVPSVVIGKDTRLSGYMLETALTSGLVSMGATVYLVGPLPTPAISHLTRSLNASAGLMISASHNPAEDNGIKIFGSQGYKLADSEEEKIEGIIFSEKMRNGEHAAEKIGKAYRLNDAPGRYIEFAKASVSNLSLAGLRIVVDCANGAAYKVAPQILSELGADVTAINNAPNGHNINLGCGATDIGLLSAKVRETNADIGIALDGDADRLVVVDENGAEVNGDRVLGVMALSLHAEGKLASNSIVVTVMSNKALENYLSEKGISLVRTKVGDRHVIEELRGNSYSFGGEQSGHIIFKDYSMTGDGIISALQFLRTLKQKGKRVSELCNTFELFPQVLVSIKVREKRPVEELGSVSGAIQEAEKKLGSDGRVLVRYSGTENVMRIMVEGMSGDVVIKIAEDISLKVREVIGVD